MRLSVATSSGNCSAVTAVGIGREAGCSMPIRRMEDLKCSPEKQKKRAAHAALASTRRRSVIALGPPGVLPVDAVEQHGQLRRPERHAGLAVPGRRPGKGALFEALVDNDVAIFVPI